MDLWQSLDIVHFALFLLLTACFASFVGRPVIHVIGWESHSHRMRLSNQYNDFCKALPYSISLYFLGNYYSTFNYIIALCTVFGFFVFGWCGECHFLKTDIHGYKHWNFKARLVIFSALLILFALAVYHFYLSYLENILFYYTIAAIVAILLSIVMPFLVLKLDNLHLDDKLHKILQNCCKGKNESERLNNPQVSEGKEEYVCSLEKDSGYRVHIHHWQMFVLFAFFTRFNNVTSNVCAGLVLGIYLHGVCAYGYDDCLCK